MKSVSAVLMVLALLAGCDRPEAPEPRTIAQRIAALGLDRDPLPDADNPILALKAPLEAFLEDTREDFETEAGLPTFLDFQVGRETLKRCWALQETLRGVIDRGPGRIPDIDTNPGGFNVFFFVQAQRSNAALAAQSLADGNPSGAAFHLAFTFELADYLCTCEPTAIPYIFAVYLKQQTFNDLMLLYQSAPSEGLLNHITTICRNSTFQKSQLESVLRSEARLGIDICRRLPDWIRGQEKEFGTLWSGFFKPPLSESSFEQLLAMSYDEDTSVARELADTEDLLDWAAQSAPLDRLPARLRTPPTPKSLAYYQSAPNGLAEILIDCTMGNTLARALVTHQILDAQIAATLAWLQAESDGIAVTSLDLLVPAYLDRVPADPCDGRPLRCIPEKRLVYSIGTDLKDDQGVKIPPPGDDDQAFLDDPFVIPETGG